MRVISIVACCLTAAGLALAGCGGDDDAARSDASALCTATAAARRGDIERARAAFMDAAHEPLHELARALEVDDRAQAARLLEAKQKVEAAIERNTLTSSELEPLVDVTDESLRVLERPGLDCAGEG